MIECDIHVWVYHRCVDNPDYPEFPATVILLDADGQHHWFDVSQETLAGAGWLKARRGGFAGETATVIVFSGDPPHEDGRCLEGRDFWDFTVPANLIRNVGTHSDPPRPKGRAKYLGPKEKL